MDGCTVFVAIVYEEREGMRHDRGGDDPKIRDREGIYIYIYIYTYKKERNCLYVIKNDKRILALFFCGTNNKIGRLI